MPSEGLTLGTLERNNFFIFMIHILATYDITNDDIERMSNAAAEVSAVSSVGDEFTKEKVVER